MKFGKFTSTITISAVLFLLCIGLSRAIRSFHINISQSVCPGMIQTETGVFVEYET